MTELKKPEHRMKKELLRQYRKVHLTTMAIGLIVLGIPLVVISILFMIYYG